jgi:hypothetical protein
MIRKKTVLVLGAGASCPFGFPSGAQLRTSICQLADHPGNTLGANLTSHFGYSQEEISGFAKVFKHSGLASIDAFLARRVEFDSIGQSAIALCISELEAHDMLFNVKGVAGASDWYGELWNRMMEGVLDPRDLRQNRLSFITFNYDRSLEAYLHQVIKATFGLNDSSAEEIRMAFSVHHVYGSLGDYLPSHGARFGPHRDNITQGRFLNDARRKIKVMPTARGVTRDEQATMMLADADVIGFMGFGFDEINCKRLDVLEAVFRHKNVPSSEPVRIFGTTMGATEGEVNAFHRRAFGGETCEGAVLDLSPSNMDCLRSFRDWGNLLL